MNIFVAKSLSLSMIISSSGENKVEMELPGQSMCPVLRLLPSAHRLLSRLVVPLTTIHFPWVQSERFLLLANWKGTLWKCWLGQCDHTFLDAALSCVPRNWALGNSPYGDPPGSMSWACSSAGVRQTPNLSCAELRTVQERPVWLAPAFLLLPG